MRIGPREGVLFGANLGRAIVINGDFTAYVCDSAATRPSSQIALGRLVHSTHRWLGQVGHVMFPGMKTYSMALLKGNVGQNYSGYEKDGVIA